MRVDFHWDRTNLIEVRAAFGRLLDSADKGSRAFIDDISGNVYKQSQLLVPVRTGRLKKSGRRALAKKILTKYQGSVEYGNTGTTLTSSGNDYAIYAHEIPPNTGGRWHTGNKHKPPTSYKYLFRPAHVEYARADPKLYRHYVARFEKDWHN